jgi:hypothetical protein
MKIVIEVTMSSESVIEMAIIRKIGDFPDDFGKVVPTFPHSNNVFFKSI